MAFKGVSVETEVDYFDLEDRDTVIDKNGNHWRALDVEADGDDHVAFWLADEVTGIRKHHLTKSGHERVTVLRRPTRADEVKHREAEVDAAEAKTDQCGVCGLWGKHDEECSRDDTDDTDAAEEVAEEVVGAEKLAEETADHEAARERADATGEPMSLPPFADMTDPEQRSHLFLVHGLYAHDVKTAKALKKMHDESHAAADLPARTAHNHDGDMPR